MSSDFVLLKHVLEQVESFPWTHALYADRTVPWSLQTKCLVHDPDDVASDDDDLPEIVVAAEMQDVLEIQDVKDIVANAKAQRPDVTLDELLQAFVFYIERDAFIAF